MINEVERHNTFVEEMHKNLTKFKIKTKNTDVVETQTEDADYD